MQVRSLVGKIRSYRLHSQNTNNNKTSVQGCRGCEGLTHAHWVPHHLSPHPGCHEPPSIERSPCGLSCMVSRYQTWVSIHLWEPPPLSPYEVPCSPPNSPSPICAPNVKCCRFSNQPAVEGDPVRGRPAAPLDRRPGPVWSPIAVAVAASEAPHSWHQLWGWEWW